MNIRKAKLEDIPAIHRLIAGATKRGKILKRSKEDIRIAIHHFWVAEEESGVVACCALEVYGKKLAEIRSLVVESGSEGKGLASLLVKKCLAEAKARKVYEVLVITNRENIFRRFGFSEQLHGQKALFLRPGHPWKE
jgi:N-acetylglutamate synthase-like GNAT family acetyltransferase